MEPTDLTTRILIEIREEQQELREELRETKQEIRATRQHLDERVDRLAARVEGVNDDLGRRILESEVRTATAIHELGGTLREVHTLLKDRALHDRVSRCEREIDDLKHRLG